MVQLIACPECKKHLQVPEELLGKQVQCPECKHTFKTAEPESAPLKTKISTSPPPPAWEKTKDSASGDGAPRKKSRRDDDEGDDDRDDDDDEDRPRRRRRSRSRGYLPPHRGAMILAFGIIGLVAIPIFGIVAWVMGNIDLREIRAGRMDPEGESMTQTGRILGMVGVILWGTLILLYCGFIGIFMLIAMVAAGNAQRFPPPPRPGR